MTSKSIYSILESKSHNQHYLKRYFNFILGCQNKNSKINLDKFEKHHICPKAKDMFPEYKNIRHFPWNNVKLTYRQHYVAHWILWKSYGIGSQSRAFHCMQRSKYLGDKKMNSKLFAQLKYENTRENHELTGKTYEERYGEERAKSIKLKISGDNAGAKSPAGRAANSAAKQNRIWVTDGVSDKWVNITKIPDGFKPGKINAKSTISIMMIEKTLKLFGYSTEEEFEKVLIKDVFELELSKTQIYKKYKKNKTSSVRDPSVGYFLKKFNLYNKLKPGKQTGLPKGTKHFNNTQVHKTLNYFGYATLEEFEKVLTKEVLELELSKTELERKYVKEFPSSRDVGIDYFLKEFNLIPKKSNKKVSFIGHSDFSKWYVTPNAAYITSDGLFPEMTGSQLRHICNYPDRKITYRGYYLNNYLKNNYILEEIKNKTFRELGFYTRCK